MLPWIVILLLPRAGGESGEVIAPHPVRFFFDEYAFSVGETQLMREAINGSGGAAVVAGESWGGFLELKGYHLLPKMDVYWAGREVRLPQGVAHGMKY